MWDSEYFETDLTEIINIVHPLKIIVNIYNMKLIYFICQLYFILMIYMLCIFFCIFIYYTPYTGTKDISYFLYTIKYIFVIYLFYV